MTRDTRRSLERDLEDLREDTPSGSGVLAVWEDPETGTFRTEPNGGGERVDPDPADWECIVRISRTVVESDWTPPEEGRPE